MKLDRENAFLNAEVKYKDKIYYIVKINEKSAYLAPDEDFLKKYEERPKGITWKEYCARYNAIMVKYSDFIEISETEISKGNNFIVKEKKEKRYLTALEEKEIIKRFAQFKKGNGGCSLFESSKGKRIVPITFNKNGQVLIRKNDKYFFYDLELNKYTFFKDLHDEKQELIWPRQNSISEKKAV